MSQMEVIALLIVLSHVVVIGAILLWFGLGKPKTAAKFRREFKKQFLGIRPGLL